MNATRILTPDRLRAIRPLPMSRRQAEFRRSTAWIRGFCAGRGAGKTRIGAVDLLLRARPGDELMVVSPTYAILEETTWSAFREAAEALGLWIAGTKSPFPQAKVRTTKGGVARIAFRTAERPDRLRGPNKAGLWLDEASLMSRDVLRWAMPVLRSRGRMGFLTLTFTPKGKRHWTYDLFFDAEGKPRPETHLVQAHASENPFLPREFVRRLEPQYGDAMRRQELGGEFVETVGSFFLREWFAFETPPRRAQRVRYWDKAATPGGGAYSVGLLMAGRSGKWWVEDVVRGQWSPAERNHRMLVTAKRDAATYDGETVIAFEQEGGSGGRESADETIRLLAGYPVVRDVVARSSSAAPIESPGRFHAKKLRALPFAAQAESGNVALAPGEWNDDYLEELIAFPEGPYADQVDATSGAFAQLLKTADSSSPPERTIALPIDARRHGIAWRK